jgi:hypothetical protein
VLRVQVELRIQLDTMSSSPRIVASVQTFNSEQSLVAITLLPTPTYDSPRDIAFDRPTLSVDGRWSDFAGRTLDDISIYLESKNQSVLHLMHFRRDVFQRHNISSAPQTWAELLQVAQQLNGTDFDGDGLPDYALCYNTQQHCGAPYMLMEVALPMMFPASSSTVKPFYLDPDTLEPNVMNAAMRAALQMLGRLSAFNDPASSAHCYPYDARFCAGGPLLPSSRALLLRHPCVGQRTLQHVLVHMPALPGVPDKHDWVQDVVSCDWPALTSTCVGHPWCEPTRCSPAHRRACCQCCVGLYLMLQVLFSPLLLPMLL